MIGASKVTLKNPKVFDGLFCVRLSVCLLFILISSP